MLAGESVGGFSYGWWQITLLSGSSAHYRRLCGLCISIDRTHARSGIESAIETLRLAQLYNPVGRAN